MIRGKYFYEVNSTLQLCDAWQLIWSVSNERLCHRTISSSYTKENGVAFFSAIHALWLYKRLLSFKVGQLSFVVLCFECFLISCCVWVFTWHVKDFSPIMLLVSFGRAEGSQDDAQRKSCFVVVMDIRFCGEIWIESKIQVNPSLDGGCSPL